MSLIRSRGNKDTEKVLASLLRRNGIVGWRRHIPVTGRPDFAFRRERIAVFVDGCFWQACPRCFHRPKTNRKFWDKKIANNRERDRKVTRSLKRRGWKVIRIWEHDLRKPEKVLEKIGLIAE